MSARKQSVPREEPVEEQAQSAGIWGVERVSRLSLFTKGKREEAREQAAEGPVAETVYGKNLSFAASEAYRLLRTNLMFALPDEQHCRIVGITSSNAGEGKSTTALNLAYMLAESDKTVILIEADMRLPTISKRLNLKPAPGLSNLLAGLNSGKEVLRESGVEGKMLVIPSGDIPPNPSELLGSEQMKTAIEVFAQMADFIILDLPPINEVSDALVVSRLVDGVVMVVRQNYSGRRALAEAMRQLEQANAKVLGFVLTAADTMNKWSGYKGGGKGYKYRKYGYRRGYGYGYGYRSKYAEAAAQERAASEAAPGSGEAGPEKAEPKRKTR